MIFGNKKKQAIKAFKDLQVQLKKEAGSKNSRLLYQLADVIKLYIGSDSDQYKYFVQSKPLKAGTFLTFGLLSPFDVEQQKYVYDPLIVIELIDSYISYIEANGVHEEKSASNNFLGTLDNATIVTLIVGIISPIGVACYQIGFNIGKSEQALISSTPKVDTVFIEKLGSPLQIQKSDTSSRFTLPKRN